MSEGPIGGRAAFGVCFGGVLFVVRARVFALVAGVFTAEAVGETVVARRKVGSIGAIAGGAGLSAAKVGDRGGALGGELGDFLQGKDQFGVAGREVSAEGAVGGCQCSNGGPITGCGSGPVCDGVHRVLFINMVGRVEIGASGGGLRLAPVLKGLWRRNF